jgi:hypothetical protein
VPLVDAAGSAAAVQRLLRPLHGVSLAFLQNGGFQIGRARENGFAG